MANAGPLSGSGCTAKANQESTSTQVVDEAFLVNVLSSDKLVLDRREDAALSGTVAESEALLIDSELEDSHEEF